MTYIVQIFSVHSDSKLVSIISSILACYPNFIDETNRDLMLSLVDKTVEKIMSPVNNSGQESNQAYNKTYECWNMLFEIVKNKTIMANFGFYIETKLQPIFEILNSSDKLEFDVNIIMIVTDIISMSTSVSDYVMGQFTNHVLNFRLSEEAFDSPKMEFFNKLTIHGKNRWNQFGDTLQNLVDKVTIETPPKFNGCRLLVLHSIIENIVINLDKEAWKKILKNF